MPLFQLILSQTCRQRRIEEAVEIKSKFLYASLLYSRVVPDMHIDENGPTHSGSFGDAGTSTGRGESEIELGLLSPDEQDRLENTPLSAKYSKSSSDPPQQERRRGLSWSTALSHRRSVKRKSLDRAARLWVLSQLGLPFAIGKLLLSCPIQMI